MGRPNYENKNLFVGSLPFSLSEDELREAFESVGTVDRAKIIHDRDTGRSKGFGFVEMSSVDEAKQAIESLNETEINGRKIVVSEAKERSQSRREDRPQGSRNRW